MEIYTNEELFRLWHESRKWERLWKQAAKKWRDEAKRNKDVRELRDLLSWEDTATRRLGLLKLCVGQLTTCPVCYSGLVNMKVHVEG
jgi:hypothetical protein